MAKTPSVLLALQAFVCDVDGERLSFSAGDPIEADHPAVKANPSLFGPLVFRHPIKGRVEQATASPGEKRDVKATPEPAPEPKGKPMRVREE